MTTKFYSPDKKKKDEERQKMRQEIEAEIREKEAERKRNEELEALKAKGPDRRPRKELAEEAKRQAKQEAEIEDREANLLDQAEGGAEEEPDLPGWHNVANQAPTKYVDPPGLRDTDDEDDELIDCDPKKKDA